MLFEIIFTGGGGNCCHPDELKHRLTEDQLYGWLAWLTRRPRGENLLSNLMGRQTAAIRNAMHGKPEDAADYIPKWQDWGRKQTAKAHTRAERMMFGIGSARIR